MSLPPCRLIARRLRRIAASARIVPDGFTAQPRLFFHKLGRNQHGGLAGLGTRAHTATALLTGRSPHKQIPGLCFGKTWKELCGESLDQISPCVIYFRSL